MVRGAYRSGTARGRSQTSSADPGRWGDEPEHAVLVAVDLDPRSPTSRAARKGLATPGERFGAGPAGGSAPETLPSTPSDRSALSSISPGLSAEESLAEFRELLLSAGGQVAAELIQRRPRPDPATLIGSGKVEEIAAVVASTNADLVVFDRDLSPTQLRNLEAALPCRVLDRTQLDPRHFCPPRPHARGPAPGGACSA